MTNLQAVEAVIERLAEADRQGWRATLARTLAGSLDDAPQASMAAQLRALMADLEDLTTGQEVDDVDDLAARRKARFADASGQ